VSEDARGDLQADATGAEAPAVRLSAVAAALVRVGRAVRSLGACTPPYRPSRPRVSSLSKLPFTGLGDQVRLRALALPVAALGVFLLTADTCNFTGGAPAGTTSTPGGTITVAKGQPMTDSNGESVTVTATRTNAVDPAGYTKPPAGEECVGVTVTVKNGSTTEWLLPLYEISIVDAAGQKYTADGGLGTCLSSDSIDSLVAGGHGTGSVYFEVPSTGALDVNWTPADLSGQVFQTPV
jgi:Domain of unknown function (DUF4352)